MRPNAQEDEFGPYALTAATDVRFTSRHVRMRLTGAQAVDWRVGTFSLDIVEGGLR